MTETLPTNVLPLLAEDIEAQGSACAHTLTKGDVVTQDQEAMPQSKSHGADATDSEACSADPSAKATELDWEALAPNGFYARFGKRACNLGLMCLVLPFALLLSIPITLVNWIQFRDLRQVLFCQPRIGLHGKTFSIYKFRTMREAPKDDFDSWGDGGDRLRVTPFGRLLRNTHLDELPQLLNILLGEMDIIGPRPEMVEIDRWACSHVPNFRTRNALLPGITGYAQITQGYAGKDDAAYAQKLSGDEYYRLHMTFLFDVVILLRTGVWMLRGRGWRFAPDAVAQAKQETPLMAAEIQEPVTDGESQPKRTGARRNRKHSKGLQETSAA
ncbi:MAG: lipopolysaccharide/colanic/teichoic acid biosynthesis glycosyltransferase [Planctomycetota bacterium]|jgi:lipopolysaccharide/colanic/teichoic acid biosynthesis glycosyltransferase